MVMLSSSGQKMVIYSSLYVITDEKMTYILEPDH